MGAKRHHSGVENELDTLVILKKLKVASKRAEHAGGTRQKADIIDSPKSFSVKLSNSYRGWEWVNTSSAVPQSIRNELSGFFDEITAVTPVRTKDETRVVKKMKTRFKEYMSNALDSFGGDELASLLVEMFVKPNLELVCAVNDKQRRVMTCFNFEDHPVVKLLNEGWEPKLLKSGGKISRRIAFTKNGEEKEANLSLVFNFNNGVNALLGLKGNKKSYLTAKIQQTRVKNLFAEVNPNIYSY